MKTIKVNRAKLCKGEFYGPANTYCPIGRVAASVEGLSYAKAKAKYTNTGWSPFNVMKQLKVNHTNVWVTNDSYDLSNEEKEARIKAIFKKGNIRIRYYGKYKS